MNTPRMGLAFAVALTGAAQASGLQGQQGLAGDLAQDTAQVAEAQGSSGRVSPGGALMRSFAIPGWGQAAAQAPGRGAFYFTVQSFSVWMLLKTNTLLGSANDILDMRRLDALDRLMADLVDPSDLSTAIEADEAVLDAVDLQQIRRQQREDWFAFSLFILFLGGADAFVAAHLADFPDALEISIRSLPDRGAELAFRVAF